MAADLEKVVLDALDSEDPNLLRAACYLAGEMRLERAERGLIRALGHKAWQVQAEAARALGRIGSKGALPFLRRLLKASEGELRQKVLAAAGAKPGSGDDSEETRPEVLRAAAIAINRIDPKVAQEALLTALAADQPALLSAAMAGLATLEAEAGRERMLELLEHSEAGVRAAAAAALGRLRESQAVPGLVERLQDDDARVRKEALIALNHIKDARALGAMADRLTDDPEAEVRRVAAIALGNTRLRHPEVVEALQKALRDRSPEVRKAALSALANLKAHQALEEAAMLLSDSHEEVARQAAVAVTVLGAAREAPEYSSE